LNALGNTNKMLLLCPRERWQSIVMCMSVCLSVCVSVREHIFEPHTLFLTIFCAFCLQQVDEIPRRRANFGGFLPHWQCIVWAV